MKLKTKFQDEDLERGEVVELEVETHPAGHIVARCIGSSGGAHTFYYDSLAELNEEWEDYEEPKETWYIDCDGEVYEPTRLNQFDLDRMSNIGNLFETKEEAEKAVEKLKAWKRLKDKGVSLEIKEIGHKKFLEPTAEDDVSFGEAKDIVKDFEFIFGGEE